MWDNNKLKNRHCYKIESDFIDWEILEMEKRICSKLRQKSGKLSQNEFNHSF